MSQSGRRRRRDGNRLRRGLWLIIITADASSAGQRSIAVTHRIAKADHAAGDGVGQALPIIGPVDTGRFHVIRDKAALDQNRRQHVLFDDDKPCPLNAAIRALVAGVELDDFRVNHRGEQDVLRIVIVAGEFLNVAASQVIRGGRGRAAGREAVGLQSARFRRGGIEVNADKGVVGIKRSDMGALVKIDKDIVRAGEDDLEPSVLQDLAKPESGIEGIVLFRAQTTGGAIVGSAVTGIDHHAANGVASGDFGRTQDGLEKLDDIHPGDEPVAMVSVFNREAHNIMNPIEIHVAGSSLKTDGVVSVTAVKAVITAGSGVRETVKCAERTERNVFATV